MSHGIDLSDEARHATRWSWTRRADPTTRWPPADSRSLVLTAGITLVIAAVAFRAWGAFTGWFYFDDYVLLAEAQDGLGFGYLLDPYHNQFMPGGRMLAWAVAHSGTLQWSVAAVTIVLMEAAANATALLMLVIAFGARPGILAPLVVYVTSTLTLPASLWWAAALNQLPMQIAFFVAVTCWLLYLRGRSRWWLLLTVLAVAAGLMFYVKALLILPVLAFIALAYFEEGTLGQRVRAVVRRRPVATAAGVLLSAGYVAYYVATVREPFEQTSAGLTAQLAETMIGTAFSTAVVGGPWQWTLLDSPTSYADPPAWAQHLSWVVIVLVVLYGFLHRQRTLRAWTLLAGYLTMLVLLVAASRATVVGAAIGLEYRYLTDAACALALCLGLAFMPLRGARESSAPRAEPLLRWRASPMIVATLAGIVAAMSVVSSIRYIDTWKTANESRGYVQNLAADLADAGAVALVDEPLPEGTSIAFEPEWNRVSTLASLVSRDVSFPDVGHGLAVVDEDGTVGQALIELGVAAERGPNGDCGWLLRAPGGTIPLQGRAFTNNWWVRVGYLASAPSDVTLTAGSDTVRARLQEGPNTLYFRADSSFGQLQVDGLWPGTSLCVTEVEVGQPVAGSPLP